MKTILITGGAGFIGSHFVEKVFDETDDRIIVLDVFTYAASPDNIRRDIIESPRFELVKGNVVDQELVNELVARSNRVVHFAAESHVARSLFADRVFYETDVLGTHSVVSAVSHNPRVEKFVHVSTSEVYGTAAYEPMDEQHPLNPCTPYASAKTGADRMVHSYLETYGIPAAIVRPFNNYGPRQHIEKVVPRFITQAILGEDLTVHGDGHSSRDWIYVGDTCEGIMKVLLRPNSVGKAFNLGTGIDISINDVAVKISSLAGNGSFVKHVDERPGQVKKHIADVRRARRELGFAAETHFWDGLRKTVEWYKAHRQWWEPLLPERVHGATDGTKRVAGAW